MKRPLYALSFTLLSLGILTLSYVMFAEARGASILLPLFFDTPYLAFRTIVSVLFLVFFFVLMGRHVILLLFSVGDQIDRAVDEWRRGQDKRPPFAPLITVIAPAYNEGMCIEASIASLISLDYPRYEVLVVDDGSSDDTLTRAKKHEGDYGNCRVEVLWKPNGGKASALNFAIERATGDYVMTMDSDSVLSRDALKEAIKYFEDPDVGAVAGAVEVVNTSTMWGRLQYLEYVKGLNLVRRAQGFLRGVSIVPGPIGVFRKDAILRVGAYSYDTFAEDCDLTLKLLLDGWKICYEPRAVARTEAPEEIIPLIKQRYRWTRGIIQAIRKHRWGFVAPKGSILPNIMLWYMVFEALVWPLMTGVSTVFLLLAGVDSALRPMAAFFWVMLLLLDMSTTLYCLGIDEHRLTLLLFAPFERMVFSIMLDVSRILASVEEFAGIHMTWGKLDRKGIK